MITIEDLDASDAFAKKAMEKALGAAAPYDVEFYRGYRKALQDLRGRC